MKHMKIDDDSIKITNEVNEKIWARGIQKPPRKIKVRVTKDSEGIVTVHLAGD
jgi:large subunit ribosomal protein L31e